jgi:hypothetical protein
MFIDKFLHEVRLNELPYILAAKYSSDLFWEVAAARAENRFGALFMIFLKSTY